MKVELSKLAAYKTEKLLQYLEEEWSLSAKERFLEKLSSKLSILRSNPEGFPKSAIRPELRRMVVTRQTSILYTVKRETVFVVTLF